MKVNKDSSGKARNKTIKLSGPQQVIDFLESLEHPLKEEIEEVRKIILSANDQITEHIKWNAPSFCYNNEDRVTFNLHGKGYFQLVFHCGAKIIDREGKGPLIEDTTGLLDWATGDRAIMKLTNMDDVVSKKEKLAELVARWIKVTSL